MEIIVLGAGAIGSLYGAKLAASNEVTLIGRAAHVAAINSHGLRIEGIESQLVRIRATTAVEQIGADALILLTTKVPGSADALAPIARDVWHKLVLNCVVNPITAILGCEVGGIANPQLNALKKLVINECVAVAATQGLIFEMDFLKQIVEVFGPSRNIASMLQDLRRGQVTEIDYLNAAVAALGAEHAVPCPVNHALAAIIKAMEERSRSLLPKKVLEPQPA